MRYLLDTNVLSHLIRGTSESLEQRFLANGPRSMVISAISWAELQQGLRALPPRRASALADDLAALASEIVIAPFDLAAAEQAGEVLARLRKVGTPIGAYDALIAGHALALGSTLVTNNLREFRRVRDLEVEDWTLPLG